MNKTILKVVLAAVLAPVVWAAGIRLSWDSNPTQQQVTEYRVRAVVPGSTNWQTVATVQTNSYTITNATAGAWSFRVTAVNAGGESDPSGAVNVSVPQAVTPPTGITVTITVTVP